MAARGKDGDGEFDAVFVGSGHNSLVAAALLARAGWRVLVLERSDYLGGAIKTAEITEPGFRHDVFSGWHPLFVGSPAYAALGADLARRGLEYLNTDQPTATLFPDGASVHLSTARSANLEEFARYAPEDAAAWEATAAEFAADRDLAFGVLGTELWSRAGLALAGRGWRRKGPRGALDFTGDLLSSARTWLRATFRSPALHGLLAPWVLHTGMGPDEPTSGFMAKVIALVLEMGGMPVPKGGGARLVEALVRLIEDHGGVCRIDAEVARVLLADGRASGVELLGGERLGARRAVICCVTPTQLYLRLLAPDAVPERVLRRARRYRYGRADMQVHMALSEPPRWAGDERLGRTAMVHLTPGLDGVSRAVAEAERSLLPAEATIVCGQPMAVDPSRGPEGSWILWLQLQELPARPAGDAAAELAADGSWTETLKERYADRIQRRLERHIPNLAGALRKRVVLSPADLERANVNLVGGDPYAGACSIDQNLLWRPMPGQPGHGTPVPNLYHIGASTHPGPGLGAGSGWLVAQRLLGEGWMGRARRLIARRAGGR
jgi:phytoene dehydrogenase-like protein